MDEDLKEQRIAAGLAVLELERSSGWAAVRNRIEAEVSQCVEEQRLIEIRGRALQDIATDFISITQKINGLRRVLEIIEEIKEERQQAERNE